MSLTRRRQPQYSTVVFLYKIAKIYISLRKRKDQGPRETEGKISYHIIYVLHHFICELRRIVQIYSVRVHTTQIFIITRAKFYQ
jgi:hypothetical protein